MEKVKKTEAEWQAILSPEEFAICRQKGTERAFTGAYWDSKANGVYRCRCCEAKLFHSDTKYDSGSGWPSYTAPTGPDCVEEHVDVSHGMERVEVTCRSCGSHLGHVFPDGPGESGLRYCINSASLKLEESDG